MKIPFDKVYILSMPYCKNRYEFVKYQLNDLNIDYEILWGTDFSNIMYDAKKLKIRYPHTNEWGDISPEPSSKDFSCAINHYNAIYQSYELGYNKILILEDDCCLIKDKNLLEYYLNNIPKDADFITYDPRFINGNNDHKQFKIDLRLSKQSNNLYIKDIGQYEFMFGAMMYAIMNKKTMKIYLENQHKNFVLADHVHGLFMAPTVNKYISSKCLCTDELNILKKFKVKFEEYRNRYTMNEILNIDNFYKPDNYHVFVRSLDKLNDMPELLINEYKNNKYNI